jgi:hypothetical protein
MKIQTSSPSFQGGISSTCRNIKQQALSALPNVELSGNVNWIGDAGEKISSAEQRLILGASALMSQPFIDAHNKNVDEKTRKVSVARTIAKIIAGTLTGFAIRKGCIKGIKAMSQPRGQNVPKWKSLFTPKDVTKTDTEAFAQYRNAMGTVVALVVMMFTNFLIDAPLTKFLTNKMIDKQEGK